jgi:amino-acid N-acetyltransferase
MPKNNFVAWFRSIVPYVNEFRGKTFVLVFDGEIMADEDSAELFRDFNLLANLGVKLVIVHGIYPQIKSRLKEANLRLKHIKGRHVTDVMTLNLIKETVGQVRIEIEALLSMGLSKPPMANSTIRIANGNYITARPIGVVDGVDLMFTGEVRKIDATAIRLHLDQGEMALLSPLGYSQTGEVFSLTPENVAIEVATALKADKLIFLMDTPGVDRKPYGDLNISLRELTLAEVRALLSKLESNSVKLSKDIQKYLLCAVQACMGGVERIHLINRHIDGAMLQELFTHKGVGCMISRGSLQTFRAAEIDDVGGILQLIKPLEDEGVLVGRDRELIEIEIDCFLVLEHDSMIIGCAALNHFPGTRIGELTCLVIHPDYRNKGFGDSLLRRIKAKAKSNRINKLFVLTTRTAHWFTERGFNETSVEKLPKIRQGRYNYKRRSKVFVRDI